MLCDDLGGGAGVDGSSGREVRKGGVMCIHIVETNTTL